MKELKHTIDLENYIVDDLKTDEDIKLYLRSEEHTSELQSQR